MSIQHNLDHSPLKAIAESVAIEEVVDTYERDVQVARAELVDAYDRALQKVIGALRISGNFGAQSEPETSQVH